MLHSLFASLNEETDIYPFAVFTSPRLSSVDALTEADTLDEALTGNTHAGTSTLFNDNRSIIYSEGNTVIIIFLMPGDEMKRTVGFFEYDGKDKKLTEGKKWLNITSLRLD